MNTMPCAKTEGSFSYRELAEIIFVSADSNRALCNSAIDASIDSSGQMARD